MKFTTYSYLAENFLKNDFERGKTCILQAAAEEEASGRGANARHLRDMLYRYGSALVSPDIKGLVHVPADISFREMVLPAPLVKAAQAVKLERENAEKLAKAGLCPRRSFLCKGAPGTGKTSYASALAELLDLPLYALSWPSIISSYLGETGKALEKALNFAASRDCVLLVDEADIIIRERDDRMEVGEMKRVVCDFLPRLEKMGWNCVVVATTNHPQTLDSAAWRRFDFILDFPEPSLDDLMLLSEIFCAKRHVPPPEKIPPCANYSRMQGLLENALRRSIIFGTRFEEEFEKEAEARYE